MDEAVRKILQLNKETKLTAKREAAKHSVISQTRKSRGLAPAGEPSGAMLDKSLYFNWCGQGKEHRPPVSYDWWVELLQGCLKLDNELLRLMGGAILSEAYGAFLIMMQSRGLITLPDWMPSQYRNPSQDFEVALLCACLGQRTWQ